MNTQQGDRDGDYPDDSDRGSWNIRFITMMMANYSPLEVVDIMKRADRGAELDKSDYNREVGPEDTDKWNKENGS